MLFTVPDKLFCFVFVFVCELDLNWSHWEVGTSIKELSLSDFPVGVCVEHFLH